jgi:formate-dependent phosphoribosylglycinamide formyltransferase (GAR transformylase)
MRTRKIGEQMTTHCGGSGAFGVELRWSSGNRIEGSRTRASEMAGMGAERGNGMDGWEATESQPFCELVDHVRGRSLRYQN